MMASTVEPGRVISVQSTGMGARYQYRGGGLESGRGRGSVCECH